MSTRRRWPLLALAVLSYAAAGFASAEDLDVGKLLDEAKAANAGKHYAKALQALSLATAEVSRLRLDGLKTLFPAAKEGWEAGEVEAQAVGALLGAGAGFSTLKRTYHKGETSVEVELTTDSPMFATVQMMATGAYVQPGTQVITVKGRKASVKLEKEQKSGELFIILNAGNAVLTIRGQQVGKAELVDVIGGSFDLDALEKAIVD